MIPPELYGALLLDQMPPCDPSAPPRQAKVMLNSDLLRIIDELGVDLSAVCERALTEQVRRLLYEHWLQTRETERVAGDAASTCRPPKVSGAGGKRRRIQR